MALPSPPLLAMDARAIAAALPADLWPVACDRLWATFAYRRLPECSDFLTAVTDELAERREAAAKVHTAYLKVRHLRWLSEKRREYDARHAATKLRERSQPAGSNTHDIVRADLTEIRGTTGPRPAEVPEVQSVMPCDGTTSQHDERPTSGDGKKAVCGSTYLAEVRRASALASCGQAKSLPSSVCKSSNARLDSSAGSAVCNTHLKVVPRGPDPVFMRPPMVGLVRQRIGLVEVRPAHGAIALQRPPERRLADTSFIGSVADGQHRPDKIAGLHDIRFRQRPGMSRPALDQGYTDNLSHPVSHLCPTERQLSRRRRRCLPEGIQQQIRRARKASKRRASHKQYPLPLDDDKYQRVLISSHYRAYNGTVQCTAAVSRRKILSNIATHPRIRCCFSNRRCCSDRSGSTVCVRASLCTYSKSLIIPQGLFAIRLVDRAFDLRPNFDQMRPYCRLNRTSVVLDNKSINGGMELIIRQFPMLPIEHASHRGGKGRQAWRILTMRRMPRVNKDVLPRATFAG